MFPFIFNPARITVSPRPQEDRLGAECEPGASVATVPHPSLPLALPLCLPLARGATQGQRHLTATGQEAVGVEERRNHGETSREEDKLVYRSYIMKGAAVDC